MNAGKTITFASEPWRAVLAMVEISCDWASGSAASFAGSKAR